MSDEVQLSTLAIFFAISILYHKIWLTVETLSSLKILMIKCGCFFSRLFCWTSYLFWTFNNVWALFVQSKSIRKCQPFLTQITPAAVCLQGMWTVFKSYEYLTFLIHAFRISFCGTYIPNNSIMDILPKHNKKITLFLLFAALVNIP